MRYAATRQAYDLTAHQRASIDAVAKTLSPGRRDKFLSTLSMKLLINVDRSRFVADTKLGVIIDAALREALA